MAKQPQNQNQAAETNIPKMAGDAMGASIKQLLLQEIKLLPKPWAAMSSGEQNDAIFRIERGITHAVAGAVNTIASGGLPRIKADIDQVTIKDKTKVTLIIGGNNSQDMLNELYQASGTPCQIVLADSEQFLGGMDLIEMPADDQPELISINDKLLWCVVIPIRKGNESVIPAPNYEAAENFAKKAREILLRHDDDLAASVYAMPWQANKQAHARMTKKGYWSHALAWLERLENGEEVAEVVGLITLKDDSGDNGENNAVQADETATATNAPTTTEESDQQADSANGGGIDNPATE